MTHLKISSILLTFYLGFQFAIPTANSQTDLGPTPTKTAPTKAVEILNVSYDPTRELYTEYDAAFSRYWEQKTGQKLTIQQSHGGSGQQARAVIDGLAADVVTLGIPQDIHEIAEAGLISRTWFQRLPDQSAPYTSTVVFVVRKGNPKQIKDWPDLTKPDVSIITPNPKTSAGGRWNYLAMWGWAMKNFNSDEAKAKDYLSKIYSKVPVLDSGARASTTTFMKRDQGDVLLAWENEAHVALNEFGKDKAEIVMPSISILAEPPVSIVDTVVEEHHTQEVSEEYLNYLYSEEGQTIIAKNYYRPRMQKIAAQYKNQFPDIKLFQFAEIFGSWQGAQKKHFDDGALFDQIYETAVENKK